MRAVFVHGFLGLPEDWSNVVKQLKWSEYDCLNLWADKYFEPTNSITKWAEHFIKQYSGQKINAFGYSMGGRLLFHAFMLKPEMFNSLVLISSNPFRFSPEEIELRKLWDKEWSDRFINDPWSEVIKDWQGLQIFKNDTIPERSSLEPYRMQLSQALVNWSPAKQVYSPMDVPAELSNKLYTFCGEHDEKYSNICKDIQSQNPQISYKPIEAAGHRVLHSSPSELAAEIKGLNLL